MALSAPKKLLPFIKELQSLKVQYHDVHTNIKNVSTILKAWIDKTDWLEKKYYQIDPEIGVKNWLIHEETDLAVNLLVWQPGQAVKPHDHKTWGVVGTILGTERNYFWKRLDNDSCPGHAKVIRQNSIICSSGEIISFLPDDIHHVVNESETVAISLHVYGRNLNDTKRYEYDPVSNTKKHLLIKQF